MKTLLLTLSVLGLFGATLVQPSLAMGGGGEDDMEVRLRDGMRNLALQLRTVQTERDDAIAKQVELEQKIQALEEQVKTLTANSAADKETIDGLKAKLGAQEQAANQLQASLEKWKTECNKATELAREKEGQRAQLQDKVILLERKVADQQRRNLEMYKVGKEILNRGQA